MEKDIKDMYKSCGGQRELILNGHSDRDGRVECKLCGAECKSVVHILRVFYFSGSAQTIVRCWM